jgi:hypothetical protein
LQPEEPHLTTEDFISELFYRLDEAMKAVPKHPQASLWSSEVVTLGVLFALKGSTESLALPPWSWAYAGHSKTAMTCTTRPSA